MRVMSMHKSDRRTEAGEPPSPELMAGMGPLIEDMAKAGVFVSGEGLRPSSTGVRLTFSNGGCTVTKGPFKGTHELVAGYCIVRTRSIEEAMEWATRFAGLVGDTEIDIRPVTEMWDLGFGQKPADDPTTRYMMVHKVDESSEAGLPASPEMLAGMACLLAYLYPRTAVLGAILLTGYLGGAVLTHVWVGDPLLSHALFPTYIGLMLWGGLFLREPRLRALVPLRIQRAIRR